MRFVGLGIDDESPDSTTLCPFRHELLGQRIYENLFARILQQFTTQGFTFREGIIVDASVIASSRRSRKIIEYAVVGREEPDSIEGAATCTIKYSDEKLHGQSKVRNVTMDIHCIMSVSADSTFILSGHMTPANTRAFQL